MTYLVAGLAALWLAFSAGLIGEVVRLTSRDARAQVAADAAALAAIAENVPGGSSNPRPAAVEYADANGATLVECLCVDGSTAVQVTVELGGVRASARAVFDPDLLRPRPGAVDVSDLHPALAEAVGRLLSETGGSVHVVSGYRDPERQAELWADALARYDDPERADDWVAPPGTSMHERGLAVDLGGDLELAARIIARLGLPLHRPLDHEPWHFELVGPSP